MRLGEISLRLGKCLDSADFFYKLQECSRLAFIKKGRSLQAGDLTDEVHNAFMGFFGDVDGDAGSKL